MKDSGYVGAFRLIARRKLSGRQGKETTQPNAHRRNLINRLAVLLSLSSFFVLLFFVSSCEKNSNPITPEVKLGKRNYTWTIDTIRYPSYQGSVQTTMLSIWGSSPQDVWTVGWNGGWGEGSIYHYNGKKWEPVYFTFRSGGPIDDGSFFFTAVYGFGPDTIWFAGGKDNVPVAISYIRRGWREFKLSGSFTLLSIWGLTSDELWFSGWQGNVQRFRDGVWTRIPFDTLTNLYSVTGDDSGVAYVSGTTYDIRGVPYVIKKRFNEQWITVDSSAASGGYPPPPWGGIGIRWIRGKLYGFGVAGAFIYEGSGWTPIIEGPNITDIQSPSENNIFLIGNERGKFIIYHWNGADWDYIPGNFDAGSVFAGVWGDGNELFVLAFDSYTTYVYHGK